MRILGLTLFIFSFLNIGDNSHSTPTPDQVTFPTEVDRLGIEVLTRINHLSIKNDWEYGGVIYTKPDGKLDATPSYTINEPHKMIIPTLRELDIKGHQIGRYHTHGAESPDFNDECFSKLDTNNVKVDQYLMTPTWSIFKFDWHNRRVYKYNPASDMWAIVEISPPEPEEEYFPAIPKLELYYKLPWLYNPNLINF